MRGGLKVPPTKSALLNLRRQVTFLQQGHDMLERKRELLTRLVYERLGQYRRLRRESYNLLHEAYSWLGVAHMRMGERLLNQASLGLHSSMQVQILPRSSVGVEYPSVRVETRPLQPVGLMWTDPSFDEARSKLLRLAELFARLGEAETALWRLLEEQRKTQKRVNALRYNVIPRYQETIQYIDSVLEEEERNSLFQLKLLRQRRQRRQR